MYVTVTKDSYGLPRVDWTEERVEVRTLLGYVKTEGVGSCSIVVVGGEAHFHHESKNALRPQ